MTASRRRTVCAPSTGLEYTGTKCPACPAVLQAAAPMGGGRATEREALHQHWLICHPTRPFKQRDAR